MYSVRTDESIQAELSDKFLKNFYSKQQKRYRGDRYDSLFLAKHVAKKECIICNRSCRVWLPPAAVYRLRLDSRRSGF